MFLRLLPIASTVVGGYTSYIQNKYPERDLTLEKGGYFTSSTLIFTLACMGSKQKFLPSLITSAALNGLCYSTGYFTGKLI